MTLKRSQCESRRQKATATAEPDALDRRELIEPGRNERDVSASGPRDPAADTLVVAAEKALPHEPASSVAIGLGHDAVPRLNCATPRGGLRAILDEDASAAALTDGPRPRQSARLQKRLTLLP